MNCCVCGKSPCDVAHIKTRGSGGSDEPFNLAPLCRRHHSESHQLGWHLFCEKYPVMIAVFRRRGWEFYDHFGVRKLRRIDDK